ncbi:DNA-directed RNA polymerase V subunit 1-like [Magnolia sinica]|uniref:DNA-directed RNA polymerase V subunit 1-like n=1 Tax=Magnolia sinica TaxID=86752 RepID=UPI00265917B1|nr:DNA-directed RNA polymerase V subunit 1-like [Magnolia sinica]
MHGQSNSVWGSQSPKGTHTERSSDIGGWNEDRGQDELNQPIRSPVWSSFPIEKSSDDSSWKEHRVPDWSNRLTRAPEWGSLSAGDRRNQRSRSTQSPAPVGPDGRNVNGILTTTGRCLDLFTCEEEKILNDVEPILLSTKRILHNSSYNDGDQLSDEDQSWVLDNVFQHHPNKATKMGEKIDYVTVADFSYLKCLENYVKEKYPDGAEAFNQKYFKKRRSEGMNQQQMGMNQQQTQ